MKRLLFALLILSAQAMAGPSDIVTNQRNATDTSSIPRTVAKPPGTQDGLMGFNGATVLPVHWTIGAGLQVSAGALVATPQDWATVTGKPAFSPVATSGAYADLTGKPTIPAAQVQADWNASTAPAAILNKPALFSGAYSALTGIPTTFAPAAHTQAFSTITATPTTLAGYGITDGLTAAALAPYATTSALTAGLATKFNTPAGTAAQYVRGDGALATLPVAKRIETYTGTTNAAGQVVVTYGTAYPAVPNVQPGPPALANQIWTVVSNTAAGFTLQLNQRNVVTLLGIEVLLGATVPVNGAPAQVLVVGQ